MASANAQIPVAGSGSKRTTASSKQSERRPSEVDRLEKAVLALIEQQDVLGHENNELRGELDTREATLHGLEERLLAETQRRQDAVKRIDDLVGLIEQLDPALSADAGSGSRAAAGRAKRA